MRFGAIARKAFGFLVRESGFRVTQEDDVSLRFEKGSTFVGLSYEGFSREIDVSLGRSPNEMITLYEALRVVAPALASKALLRASGEEALRDRLEEAAALVKEYCVPLLLGDPGRFEKVAEEVARARHERTKLYRFGPIQERANDAWMRKDFAEARRLYESIREHLTEAERRRLQYLSRK